MLVRAWRYGLVLVVALGVLVGCEADAPATDAPTREADIGVTVDEETFLEPTTRITPDNAPRLRALGVLERPTGRVSSVFHHAISLDGTRLAALNNDLLIMWNLITGRIVYVTTRGDAIRVYFAPGQDEVYLVLSDGVVRVMASDSARSITEIVGNQNFNGHIAYDRDAGHLALGGRDGTVRVWDMAQRTSLATLQAHEAPLLALGFDGTGQRLATTAEDQLARVWDWRERRLLNSFDHIDTNPYQVRLSPDGLQVVTGTERYVAVWDTEADALQYSLAIERGGASDLLAYSPDGRWIASAGGISNMLVWWSETGEVIATLPEVSGERLSGRFGAGGGLLLTSVLDRAVSLWDIANADADTVPRATLDIGTRRIVRVDWTDDDFVMLFFDVEGTVYAWGIHE